MSDSFEPGHDPDQFGPNTSNGRFPAAVRKVTLGNETASKWFDEILKDSPAWFLGPKAENVDLLQDLVSFAITEHAEFRKYKYYPLDPEFVDSEKKQSVEYKKSEDKMWKMLGVLSKRLQNSIPFSNFRSQGHMLWDTTIAANVGYIAALLYNQNNVASMASSVTLQLEREVAKDLCAMVGYNVDDHNYNIDRPLSWGHLPNGGTVANIEAMWAARCLKYNALALKMMLRIETEKGKKGPLARVWNEFKFRKLDNTEKLLKDGEPWELLNIPIDNAIELFNQVIQFIKDKLDCEWSHDQLFAKVVPHTMEEMGALEFFQALATELKYTNHKMGKWFVSGSRHYSWDKGNNMLGLGRRNLVKVSVDRNCRMDMQQLRGHLQDCLKNKIPVIGVTAVFGTTQEGAVDNLREILKLRKEMEKEGLTFYIHIDGAWGGYFASTLNNNNQMKTAIPENSESIPDSRLSSYFTSQLQLLKMADSITLDPHKTGFCPYPAGGLLYRNGNIRNFLAQKAAYVNHGEKDNEEINLYGIDGSKPGAASASVWLSHRTLGLHNSGYGLILRQCNFSAGIMYALWASLERPEDPFTVVTAQDIVDDLPSTQKEIGPKFSLSEGFSSMTMVAQAPLIRKWTKARIRKEILEAENITVLKNAEAMKFIADNGPDTLINCVSANFRRWDSDSESWVYNSSIKEQRRFIDAFYKRCSHSMEKPSLVDRGVQIILNSTTWEESTHNQAYQNVKGKLGLKVEETEEDKKIKMIINTTMSPWLRTQNTFERMANIIRNELYNAYGAVTDVPDNLSFVSPCSIESYPDWNDDGFLFAELQASFMETRQNHAIGLFCVRDKDRDELVKLAEKAEEKRMGLNVRYCPLKFKLIKKMTIFNVMTGSNNSAQQKGVQDEIEDEVDGGIFNHRQSFSHKSTRSTKQSLEKYSDKDVDYHGITLPELDVEFSYGPGLTYEGKLKLRRVIRYHHLARDFVDEKDYPANNEYIMYSYSYIKKKEIPRLCTPDDAALRTGRRGRDTLLNDRDRSPSRSRTEETQEFAYISHCPNRFPDFQQLIELDEVPVPVRFQGDSQQEEEEIVLYKEAVSRGVIIYLPQIQTGGRPILKRGNDDQCLDPLTLHEYNAVSWSDQGAYTGNMMSIKIKLMKDGKRWFDGSSMNKGYDKSKLQMFYNKDGSRRHYPEETCEQEIQDSYELPEDL